MLFVHNEPALAATLEEAKATKRFPDAANGRGELLSSAINRPDDALREFQAGAKENPDAKAGLSGPNRFESAFARQDRSGIEHVIAEIC